MLPRKTTEFMPRLVDKQTTFKMLVLRMEFGSIRAMLCFAETYFQKFAR